MSQAFERVGPKWRGAAWQATVPRDARGKRCDRRSISHKRAKSPYLGIQFPKTMKRPTRMKRLGPNRKDLVSGAPESGHGLGPLPRGLLLERDVTPEIASSNSNGDASGFVIGWHEARNVERPFGADRTEFVENVSDCMLSHGRCNDDMHGTGWAPNSRA